ncbi:hypothetical protein ACPA2N_26040 [Ectopseudomonas hydrolytica]|uniref:hypothetical protein n=1 Tax=Ectopseudomonas hydrolytica TaxID=2493633 RepID=UPI003C2F5620
MTDKRPVVLEDLGGGQGRLRELATTERLLAAALPVNNEALAGLAGVADRLPYFTGVGALSLAVLTTLARSLLAGGTQADMRSTLGLVLQTATDDATAGRVLTVGAGGLLTSTPPQEAADMNNRTLPQFLRVSSAASNRPPWAGAVASGALVIPGGTASRCTQIHSLDSVTTSPRLGVRNLSNSGFTGWVELYHTGNLVLNQLATFTLATLPSAAANPRLQVFVSNLTGQPAPCYSDGTNWRRVSDDTIAN